VIGYKVVCDVRNTSDLDLQLPLDRCSFKEKILSNLVPTYEFAQGLF